MVGYARAHALVHADREKVREYMFFLASRGGGFFKAKDLREHGVSPKIVGSAMGWFLEHPDSRFRISKRGFTHSTLWEIRPPVATPVTLQESF